MSVHLGGNCILKRGTAHYLPASIVTMTNVRDVTFNMESGEADVSTRATQDWRVYLATLKEATLEFDMIVDSSDADYAAIRSSFLMGTRLYYVVKADNPNNSGFAFYGEVTGFAGSQPLEEGETVSVTIRNAGAVLQGM